VETWGNGAAKDWDSVFSVWIHTPTSLMFPECAENRSEKRGLVVGLGTFHTIVEKSGRPVPGIARRPRGDGCTKLAFVDCSVHG